MHGIVARVYACCKTHKQNRATMQQTASRTHCTKAFKSNYDIRLLPAEVLMEVLASDELNVKKECIVLKAIARWAGPNSETTSQLDVATVLSEVRIGLITKTEKQAFEERNQSACSTTAYKSAVSDAWNRGPCMCFLQDPQAESGHHAADLITDALHKGKVFASVGYIWPISDADNAWPR
ncbi:uncharacterized protein [Dermacentor andersoni]|uniref:uncharacterized protein n=1 Tax=Dermacentor andersoni TaxID=34620 RepID=UPI002417BC59|nr:uncharacterized protein LOC126518323 [Dermacentor andersoni]